MKINYGDKMNELDFNKLNGALAEKGVYLIDSFSRVDTDNYGYVHVEENTTVYGIVIENEVQFTVDWESDAKIITDGLYNLHKDCHYNEINTTVKTQKWAEPEGTQLQFTIPLDGEVQNFDCWGNNHILYENGAKMYAFLENDYIGMVLRFRVVWEQENVQRKEAIEDAMVQTVLNDMGKIQKAVESRLKLKKFGYNVEEVGIDCHFDAKTESRSECAPDIIKQVREARKGN
ncbi:MAG: hypothetical protein CL605_03625 [Altibacter sp.]|uniref:hypothetical protein n=1 Tax=Altibacter sp. TaxID=2024823 RepID=UPI000C8CC348|nr:hypothetical protein [Altibacter sp.]MAP53971.1 hypothetical protein [Altibacter sp.]|tara:strand:+ start:765 stop:1460 length:696 start_codon:yes stop_codon:yes gene_type:complete